MFYSTKNMGANTFFLQYFENQVKKYAMFGQVTRVCSLAIYTIDTLIGFHNCI